MLQSLLNLVFKDFVKTLNLSVRSCKTGAVQLADDSTLKVKGVVEIEICVFDTPVRFHAIYVPDIKYQLIIGTDVLEPSGVQLVCSGRVLWPLQDDVNTVNNIDVVNVVMAPMHQYLLRATQRAVIPPLCAMNIRSQAKRSKGVAVPQGDVLVEACKVPLHGDIARQVRTVDCGYVDVLVTNTSATRSISICLGNVLAKASSNCKFWHDDAGVTLTFDEIDRRTQPTSRLTPTSEDDDASHRHLLSRKERRTMLKKYRRYLKSQRRVNNINIAALGDISEALKSTNISGDLKPEEKQLILELLERNKDLFSIDIRITTPLIKHDIETSGPPIKQHAYRTPYSEIHYVHKYIETGLNKGLFRSPNSPSSSH